MEQMTSKYFAFISYSSSDKAWAKWLQKKLEQYRLPTRLQKKYRDVSRRAYPICRDDTDIAGFKVWDALTDLLDDSKYLIVICSPRSAKSEWVNKEIQYFIDHGKENQIMPFIVEGVPHSGDPETECFPPAILNMREDPLGVDVTALGKRKACLRAVSTLLGVEFEELLMRDTVRRVRNGVMQGVAAMAAVAALCSGIWYNMEHSKYYSAVAYRNELPVGVYPLSEEERAHRAESYKITTRRGRVVRLERVNSMDQTGAQVLSRTIEDHPRLDYQYDEDGELITIIQKDETGVEVTRKVLMAVEDTNQVFVDFVAPASKTAQGLSADMSVGLTDNTKVDMKSDITRCLNTYDEKGHLLRTFFHRNNLGEPACDSNGVYGKSYEYNEQGLITRVNNLDTHGNLVNCKYGWAYVELDYDDMGCETVTRYYDTDGNRATGKMGNSGIYMDFDEYGNAIRWSAVDASGDLITTTSGYAVAVLAYDERGLCTSFSFLGADLEPVYDTDLIHEVRCEYDAMGRRIRESCYDTQGKPAYSPILYYSRAETDYDENGRMVEIRHFDAKGNPAPDHTFGNCGLRFTYDVKGRLQSVTTLNEQWEPTPCYRGFAAYYLERDRDGQVIWEEYWDVDGAPVRNSENYAALQTEYDVFGNAVRYRFLDENKQPCYYEDGYAVQEMTYEGGKEISRRYLNTAGEPTVSDAYYYEVRKEYDERGNCIRKSYYGTDGELVNLKDGYAVETTQFDDHGNVTLTRYYDATHAPACDRESGVFGVRYAYDGRGNCVRTEYLDAQGDLMIGKKGFAVQLSYWDGLGREYRTERLDVSRALVQGKDNWAAAEYEYDDLGNVTQKRYYDAYGAPCYHSDGYFKVESTYDAGKLVYEAYFDTDSEPVLNGKFYHARRMEYDDKGNCVQITYLDTVGNLIDGENGYARKVYAYDAMGHRIQKITYSADGAPAAKDTFYQYDWEYDNMGNKIREVRYSVNPELTEGVIGEADHDIRGRETEVRYFNADHTPVNSRELPFRITYEYDLRGNRTLSKAMYGESEESALIKIFIYEYDEFGNKVHQQAVHQEADGEVFYSSVERSTYDAFGNCIVLEYLDENGELDLQEDGYAAVKYTYSPQGYMSSEEYYDDNWNPCLEDDVAFRYEYERDANGELMETRRYDLNRELCKESDGLIAITRYDRDPRGLLTDVWNYNEKDQPVHWKRSHVQYVWDNAGYQVSERCYDQNEKLMVERNRCAVVSEVIPGYPTADAGIAPGDGKVYIILQLGAWNYYQEHISSSMGALYAEVAKTVSTEKTLILCEITRDGIHIRRYDLPAGSMGLGIEDSLLEVEILDKFQEVYQQWLSQQP